MGSGSGDGRESRSGDVVMVKNGSGIVDDGVIDGLVVKADIYRRGAVRIELKKLISNGENRRR